VGLGKLLLRRLSAVARDQGISHFRAHTLPDNTRIRAILRASRGVVVDSDSGVLVYDVDIRPRRPPRRDIVQRLLRALFGP
jgi:hypothetical protein